MKKIFSIILVLTLVYGMTSCTSDFDEINTNPGAFTSLTNDDAAGLYGKESRFSFLGGDYQLNQGLHSDLYAQHFATIVTYFSSDRYVYHPNWDAYLWQCILIRTAPYSYKIYEMYDENTAENAMARICYVYGMEMLCDRAGAIPYGAGSGKAAPFVDQSTAYHAMIEDLTKAAAVLSTASSSAFASKDRIYEGDCKKWMKFANTMRLRIAMRLVNKEPDYAKTQAEAAYSAGVMTSADDDAWFKSDPSIGEWTNYISQTASWHEFGMSSTIYSYMVGWSDPRLGIYFQVSPKTNDYHCVRNGMPSADINSVNATEKNYVSNIGTNWVTYNASTDTFSPIFTFPRLVLPAADAFFLRSEGALRGWNMGGTAKDLYEQGIKASMKSWGVSDADVAAYLNVTADPCAPNDYYKSPAVCTDLSVKFDESAGTEKQLQQIITQRWLALYTTSGEAWAEYRRTGYPVMYPPIDSDDPDIAEGQFIQRILYPDGLKNSEGAEAINNAIKLNGGTKDSQATKLYYAK